MKIILGYNNTPAARAALRLAREHAQVFNAKVFIITSMEGGNKESFEEIREAENALISAENFMKEKGVDCETHQLVLGRSPSEDIIWYAREKGADFVFVGVEKKSRAQKFILGSTAQAVILHSPCPVITVKR